MIPVEFLTAILPSRGIPVIVTGGRPVKDAPGRTTMHPHIAKDLGDAAAIANRQSGQFDVYFALHTMRETKEKTSKSGRKYRGINRTAENAALVQCFYLDLDVGLDPDKYVSQGEALAALKGFRKKVGLPTPMVVNSGRGVHAYWRFAEAVTSAEWKPAAETLKRLTAHHGLKADHQVTADAARMLRVVGTFNRKDPANPLPVAAWHAGGPPTAFSELVATITAAAGEMPVSAAPTGLPAGIAPLAAVPETPENVDAVRGRLNAIDPDVSRDDWRRAVWGVASLGWAYGERLARGWSARGEKFDEGAFETMWGSFDPTRTGGITWRTLEHLALQHGYIGPNLTAPANEAGSTVASAQGLPDLGAKPAGMIDSASEADIANGERLAAAAGGHLLWVRESGEWLRFDRADGWLSMPRDEVEGFAMIVAKTMRREAGRLHDVAPHDPGTKAALANSKRASARPHMLAMIEMAKAVPGMAASLADFDADPMLLGVRNGVLDLRTGQLRAFAPELRLSKRAAVAFAPSAGCPLWDAFLARVLPDQQVRAFLQRWIGYCLTGDVGAHKWVFLFGSGANGKSVFTETLAHLMGDYSHALATEVLMDDPRGGRNHDPDILALQGKRLAFASETEEGQRLASARVKRLTGGDTLSGRRPYGRAPESFPPTHKVMMSGNHHPAIPDPSNGTWRRIATVDFEVEIPEHERDPDLTAKMREEGPGILNWALAGLANFQANGGLKPPQAVMAATGEYQHDEDVFGQFLTERCKLGEGPAFKVPDADLYEAFSGWCLGIGRKHVPTKTMLTRQLKSRRVTLDRNAKAYIGVRLTLRAVPPCLAT